MIFFFFCSVSQEQEQEEQTHLLSLIAAVIGTAIHGKFFFGQSNLCDLGAIAMQVAILMIWIAQTLSVGLDAPPPRQAMIGEYYFH